MSQGANIQIQMNPTLLSFSGHMQGQTQCTLAQDSKKLITLGCDDLIFKWSTEDMTSRTQIELANKNQQLFTCIEYVQRDQLFVLGTRSGLVVAVSENDTSDVRLLYRSAHVGQGSGGIRSLSLGCTLRFLAIASGEDKGVVYDLQESSFYRCDTGHQGMVTFANLCLQDRILITLGSQGYSLVYSHQPGSLQLLHRYQICHNPSITPKIRYSQHPSTKKLSLGGATTLQELHFSQHLQCTYKIKAEIHEENELILVHWLNQNVLVLGLAQKVCLWNYVTATKFHVLNQMTLTTILCGAGKFYGVDCAGLVYRYDNANSIQYENQQAKKYLQRQEAQANNHNLFTSNINLEQGEQQIAEEKAHKPQPQPQPQPSKSSTLLTKPPQTSLQSFYPSHLDFQFLFYNQHGCIIKQSSSEEQVVELQYHDKFKLRKIKFEGNGKYYFYALTHNCFMYASLTHVYFQMEGVAKRDQGLVKWDYNIGNVNGVAVGNTWAVVACQDYVRIFDLFGNELGVVCNDRMFLAMAVYEDILALAYSASLPLAECHIFELKLYRVTNQSIKLERVTKLPVRVEHELKWLGFSEEGALFNQDSSETVRMYCWDSNEWVNVYQEDPSKYRLYIQHIEKCEIYGFRIEQREGQPVGPTVLPRSLPRKIPFELPDQKVPYFSDEENKKLQSIQLRQLWIQHETFRSQRWFKLKYSRQEGNPLQKQSESINSEQAIQQMKIQLDLHVVEQIRKILPSLQSRYSGTELQGVKFQVLALCHSLLYYQESIGKVTGLIGIGNQLVEYCDPLSVEERVQSRRYDRLGRLGALVDMGWIERTMD